MTDTSLIATPEDGFPAFNEAAALADIEDYNPDRARGAPPAPRAFTSGPSVPFRLPMLAPEQRGDIPQRLAGIADPAERERMEGVLVEQRMRELANAANVRRGHPNGNVYDREVASITTQVADLEAESARLHEDLNTVARWETRVDPATGQPVPEPIYLHSGAARARMEQRRLDIVRNILALHGEEGHFRLKRAAQAELEKRRAAHEDARILREADRRAKAMVADERIAELAAVKAKALRGNG